VSRFRLAIVVGVLVVFAAVGAYLIFGHKSASGQSVTINVTVTGAKSIQPSELSVHQNDTVTINVTSDTAGTVHLHGYNIAFDARAGQVVSHTFMAINSGKFDIEWESTSAPLGHLTVNP
jgi:FtsP/CotA-like multicopper oxidase with cupredoxin domain